MEGYFGTGSNRYQGDGFRMTRIVRFMATYSELPVRKRPRSVGKRLRLAQLRYSRTERELAQASGGAKIKTAAGNMQE